MVLKDLTGLKFNQLTVLSFAGYSPTRKGKVALWNCLCKCGNKTVTCGGNLRSGRTKSCGCLADKVIDRKGQRIGSLVASRFIGTDGSRNAIWEWDCDCGTTINLKFSQIKESRITCCGCQDTRVTSISGRRSKHGHRRSNQVTTRAYKCWCAMYARCNRPNSNGYKNYGGRGIKICDRWTDFRNFLQDMGEPPTDKHQLDRIDVNGSYEPRNCRWATQKEQANNRRNSRRITFGNETKTVADWARCLGFPPHVLYQRLNHYPAEVAFTSPYPGSKRGLKAQNSLA